MSRELLARAWAAGAGPGDGPLTIDLDSTICETHGLAKEAARRHGYTGQRGYPPLLAVAAGTGRTPLRTYPSSGSSPTESSCLNQSPRATASAPQHSPHRRDRGTRNPNRPTGNTPPWHHPDEPGDSSTPQQQAQTPEEMAPGATERPSEALKPLQTTRTDRPGGVAKSILRRFSPRRRRPPRAGEPSPTEPPFPPTPSSNPPKRQGTQEDPEKLRIGLLHWPENIRQQDTGHPPAGTTVAEIVAPQGLEVHHHLEPADG